MTSNAATPAEGRTHWRRFALAFVPAAVAVAGVLVATGEGALASSFTISGQQAKISADSLDGVGFVQYGWLNESSRDAIPVATSAMKSATLKNMCQSVVFDLPIVGKYTLRIEAGKSKPVEATNIFIDMNQLSGDAVFTNIEIGRDASTLNKGPSGAQGFQDMFAQQADKIHIDGLRQTMYATTAGTFRLNGLGLNLDAGVNECW